MESSKEKSKGESVGSYLNVDDTEVGDVAETKFKENIKSTKVSEF